MSELILSLTIVSCIGALSGLILSIASIIMHVPKNESIEKITEILPGANCGACGFSGCHDYAKSLVNGISEPNLCIPGGKDVLNKLSKALGKEVTLVESKIAYIKCDGTFEKTSKKAISLNISSCAVANQLYAGTGKCPYGCLGFGDCINICKYNAIYIDNGIAHVDINKCVGCGACIKVCPKNIIILVEPKSQALVSCSNKDKGILAKHSCSASCIACRLCEKACPVGAIYIENNLAFIDSKKCIACYKCQDICPQGCIVTLKSL